MQRIPLDQVFVNIGLRALRGGHYEYGNFFVFSFGGHLQLTSSRRWANYPKKGDLSK